MAIRRWILAVTLFLIGCAAYAQEWPQFRGPNGGYAPSANPPTHWSETENVRWKTPIPGRGRSSPVVMGDRIYLTTAIETGVQRVTLHSDDMQSAEHVTLGAVCVDRRDGKILWHVPLFDLDKPAPVHWLNYWATPTPVLEKGRVYCDFGTYGTGCLEAGDGKVVWRRTVPVDHMVGPGSSPIIWRNLLILTRDGIDAQFVAALDKATGDPVWKTTRPPLHGPDAWKKAFSTPIVVASGAQPQIVIPGAQWIVSYDPATGKELWRVNHGDGFSFGTAPVAGNGLVYVGTGLFKPQIWAIRPDGSGDVTATHVAWKSSRQGPDMSSPVLAGGSIYWVSDNGIACCTDAKTGELTWQQPVGGQYLASPLFAGGRLYLFNDSGKAKVLKPGKEPEVLAENALPGPLAATPALVGGAMYLRTDTTLYCIQEGGATK